MKFKTKWETELNKLLTKKEIETFNKIIAYQYRTTGRCAVTPERTDCTLKQFQALEKKEIIRLCDARDLKGVVVTQQCFTTKKGNRFWYHLYRRIKKSMVGCTIII